MGHLFYGNTTESFEIPDRLLAHVKMVTATKLRRSESFTLSWQHRACDAPGRTTLWMQPSIPLRFVFEQAESVALDSDVLKRLSAGANTSAGLTIDLDEMAEDPRMALVTAA